MLQLLQASYLVVFIVNFVVGFIVLTKGRKRVNNILFFVLVLILNGWIVGNLFANTLHNQNGSDFGAHLSFFFGILIVPIFVLFVLFFPQKSSINWKLLIIILLPACFFTYYSFSKAFVDSMIIRQGNINLLSAGRYHWWYSIYIMTNVLVFLYLFYKKYREQPPLERLKLKYVLLGFLVASTIGMVFDLILQPILKVSTIGFYGSLGTIFISISVGYAILKYRLFDIKVVIKKGLVYFLTLVLILFLYIYILVFSQQILVKQYQWSEQTTTILLVLIIVLTLEPIRRLIQWAVDRVFFRTPAQEEQSQENIKLLLSTAQQFESLASKLETELKNITSVPEAWFLWNNRHDGYLESYQENSHRQRIKSADELSHFFAEKMSVIVTEELPYQAEEADLAEAERLKKAAKKLKEMHVSLVLPIGEPGDLLGAFFFGPRPGKDAFTADIVQRLQQLQRPVTSAVANALFYKQAVERIASINH